MKPSPSPSHLPVHGLNPSTKPFSRFLESKNMQSFHSFRWATTFLCVTSALLTSSNAGAQETLRRPIPLALRDPISAFSASPPRPDVACIFTQANLSGQRACISPQDGSPMSNLVSGRVNSFAVPYGFEIVFYRTQIATPVFQESDAVCSFQSRTPQRYMDGSFTSSWVKDNPTLCGSYDATMRSATGVALRKLPDITDAQRQAVWNNWSTSDNETCAVKVLTTRPLNYRPYPRIFDQLSRVHCFGLMSDMLDFAHTMIPSGGTVPETRTMAGNVTDFIIKSPHVSITLWSGMNFEGNSVKLMCGHHRLGGALIGAVGSAQLTISPQSQVSRCPPGEQIASAWTSSPPLQDGPFARQITPR